MPKIPADDVYAQWAYSELNSLEQGALYVGVDDLRTKAADNVPFTELSPQERAFLLRQWREVRAFDGSIFAAELANVKTFQLEYWTKAQLGSAYILQHFLQWLAPDHKFLETTLKDWIEAEPSDVLSAHHPLRTPSTGVSFTQEAPVTAARLPQLVDRFLLLDGYHRAAHFWKMAGPASEIAVFVPVQ
jgi:hypothetical protein